VILGVFPARTHPRESTRWPRVRIPHTSAAKLGRVRSRRGGPERCARQVAADARPAQCAKPLRSFAGRGEEVVVRVIRDVAQIGSPAAPASVLGGLALRERCRQPVRTLGGSTVGDPATGRPPRRLQPHGAHQAKQRLRHTGMLSGGPGGWQFELPARRGDVTPAQRPSTVEGSRSRQRIPRRARRFGEAHAPSLSAGESDCTFQDQSPHICSEPSEFLSCRPQGARTCQI